MGGPSRHDRRPDQHRKCPTPRTSIQQGVKLEVAQHAMLHMAWSVGELSQNVTVMANAEMLDTQSADRGLEA